jgi:hypothetical protein
MTRDEARGWLAQTLMEKVRKDRYPSATQLAIIEEVLPRAMVPDYLQVLIDKAAQDNIPSIPLLRRISRIADSLPATEARR